MPTMGDLISLAERRTTLVRTNGLRGAAQATFYFDLVSPFTYLAAERVERLLGAVRWQPALGAAIRPAGATEPSPQQERDEAERRAAALRMPLVWPDRFPPQTRAAMRAAVYACEAGRGDAFALAASRLAYCGGFDLEDPEVLAEAAAAAGVSLSGCLQAAGDAGRDEQLEATARRLAAAGADRLPAVRVGRLLVCGEERIAEAAARISESAPKGAPRIGESLTS
jgi:2-hydroxychromene-2-carboxylate isomerase